MKDKTKFIITITRELGSGGAYIGQQLAKKLDILYMDREIIHQAALKLSVSEEDVECCDEKKPSFWQSFNKMYMSTNFQEYVPPQILPPNDKELFEVESEIIKCTAKEHSAVIIGRCSSFVLLNQKNHIKIFLYGNKTFRKERIKQLYNLSDADAEKMIIKGDKERASYHHMRTGRQLTDAAQYHLCIDTSNVGVDSAVDLIIKYMDFV